jgi:multicomponent Na+:H+ antiporter subunit A
MLFIVLLGLIASILLVPFGKFFRSKWSVTLAIIPISLFCYFASQIFSVAGGTILLEQTNWVPSLGLNLNFRLDGLSLLFSLLITGIGSLIFIYASSYLKGHPYLDRFFGFLCLFMASMLGVVLSDNILLLFVFWEMTSISSFFLIGFNNDHADSRKSAVVALSITGLGGFFLLAGFILIGQIAGTYSIHELIDSATVIKNHALYPLVLALVFIGAFTKSAQFPFHFWLPDAMKAPTPVSAYLHSATMVKAGIFLLTRFTPILGNMPLWNHTLLIVGGFTMLYAALHALFRTDLKGILAYSTISALGILTFLIGLGTKEALIAACTFIIAHALYKATLFLTTGIIDHETGTRDIAMLSGLKKVLFPVFIAGGLAALSSGGMPLFLGFIGKDLIYEATLTADQKIALYLTIAVVLTNICLVAVGFMAGVKPFVGKLEPTYEKIHLPYASMWVPPLVLAFLGLLFGLFPGVIGELIVSPTVSVLSYQKELVHLKIWHGFNTVLVLSLATLGVGALLYVINKPANSRLSSLMRFDSLAPQTIFRKLWSSFTSFSAWYTDFMHNGFLRSYLLRIIIFAELLLAYELFMAGPLFIDYSILSPISIYEAMNVLVLIAALFLVVKTSSRLTAVVGTSVVGYAICLMFVFYGAPDLAMTQFTIDTLTVVLFVFVLFNLPPFLKFPTRNKKVILRDTLVALSFGTILSLIAIKVLQVPTSTEVRDFYGEYAYTLAKGKNVVNVILVDFRGFDTMFEIIVLSIAAIGVYSLIKLRLKPSERE